jgi:hypothetical protein
MTPMVLDRLSKSLLTRLGGSDRLTAHGDGADGTQSRSTDE